MDKLKAGLRGDDSREPAVVTPPAGVAPSESPMATTGKKLRELIREASGYSTTMEATTTESAPEKKGGHTLDAVLRWRSGAKDESRLASEDLEAIEFVRQYSGPPLAEGTKSVSYRLTIAAPDRTLSSEEVGAVRSRIIDGMRDLGYDLRV